MIPSGATISFPLGSIPHFPFTARSGEGIYLPLSKSILTFLEFSVFTNFNFCYFS